MSDTARHAAAIERDGYTIIEDFLAPAVLTEVRRVLALYLGSHAGRNGFEGLDTERVKQTYLARFRAARPSPDDDEESVRDRRPVEGLSRPAKP